MSGAGEARGFGRHVVVNHCKGSSGFNALQRRWLVQDDLALIQVLKRRKAAFEPAPAFGNSAGRS